MRAWIRLQFVMPHHKLDKLRYRLLSAGCSEEQIGSRLEAIKRQKLTNLFYLPKGGKLQADSAVYMDRICHCRSDSISRESVPDRRLFTLSNVGAYLFFLKLSVHLLRMTDKVVRSTVQGY